MSSVAFSLKGKWLATAASEVVQLWRVGHYEAPVTKVRTMGQTSIAFRPDDGALIVADGIDLQEWFIEADADTVKLEAGNSKPIEAHTVAPVGETCFAAAASDAVHLLCDTSLDEVLRVPTSSLAAAVSPDGRWLFNEQTDGVLGAWPLDAGLDALRIGLGAPIRSMASSDQRGWVAVGTDGGEVAIVGADSWKEQRKLRLTPATPVGTLTASADGRWLVAVQGTSLHIFDTGNWREVASRTYDQDVARAAFVTGDRLVVVAGTQLVVLQSGDWRERLRLSHDVEITGVNVSPDRRQLATSTYRLVGHQPVLGTRVFNLESGNETAPVPAASSWPAVNPDERVSANGAWNVGLSPFVATLSDVASGRVIGRFDHGGEITSVRFVPSREPRWLVTAGLDGTLAVWPIRTEDLVRQTCARMHALFDQKTLRKLIADAHAEGSCE
jgi:WD40 repeat protein